MFFMGKNAEPETEKHHEAPKQKGTDMKTPRRPILAIDMDHYHRYLQAIGIAAAERQRRAEAVWQLIYTIAAYGFKTYPLQKETPRKPPPLRLGKRIPLTSHFNNAAQGGQ